MNKEASIKVLASTGEFFAEKVCDTFEEAVDVCLDALVRQLSKYKENKEIIKKKRFLFVISKIDLTLQRFKACR